MNEKGHSIVIFNMRKRSPLLFFAILLAVFARFVAAEAPSPSKTEAETGLEGVILVGPIKGGPTKQGVPDSRPLANIEFVVTQENKPVTSFKTDDQGRFRVSLPSGHYSVSRKDWKASIGRYGPFEVDIIAGQIKSVQWTCDTGMR